MSTPRPWRAAWDEALYGPAGFALREPPVRHFRTSVHVPGFAAAVAELAHRVDRALGRPDPFDLVDLGAGRGELLHAVAALDVPARWRLTAVELAPDPGGPLRWLPQVPPLTGLLLAHEWLDDVPLDVLDGNRLVLVSAHGTETLGPPAPAADRAWAARWWPGGGRVEVGLRRDQAWAGAVAQVHRGLAVAVDYGHTRADRRPTLTGWRAGRPVPPVPDGSCNLTAHVALDSLGGRLTTQAAALGWLGVEVPAVPAYAGGARAHLAALSARSAAAELTSPAGLGAFGWVLEPVGLSGGTLPAWT